MFKKIIRKTIIFETNICKLDVCWKFQMYVWRPESGSKLACCYFNMWKAIKNIIANGKKKIKKNPINDRINV